jgi:acyl-CoA thioesterase
MNDASRRPPAIDLPDLAARDAFVRSLGIELVDGWQGGAVCRVAIEARHLNFNGVVHGGLVFSLADAALGYASNAAGRMTAAIDAHIVYSRPTRVGDVLTATASELSRTTRLASYRIDIVRGDGSLVAAMTGTTFIADRPPGG